MSDPTACFMLIDELDKKKTWGAMSQDREYLRTCPISPGNFHRVEIEIPLDLDLEQASPKYLPVRCECGFELNQHNSSCWTSTQSHKYTNPQTGKSGFNPHLVATPGAMWYCPWLLRDEDEGPEKENSILGPEYLRDWYGKRPPICVKLPNGGDWVVDQKAKNRQTGWTVTGDAPTLTCHPSIDAGSYHSYLTGGILGADPDCKGIV